MADIFSLDGLTEAAKRTVRTFAQALASFLGVGSGLAGVDWKVALGAAGGAALLSFLHAVSGDVSGGSGASGRHAVT
ncbi:holin [Tomitella gaofuii]|uniref:holin n=1 Tax=Tomitella gaofuii TaxID=2760083 RepID=UPI0015FC186D